MKISSFSSRRWCISTITNYKSNIEFINFKDDIQNVSWQFLSWADLYEIFLFQLRILFSLNIRFNVDSLYLKISNLIFINGWNIYVGDYLATHDLNPHFSKGAPFSWRNRLVISAEPRQSFAPPIEVKSNLLHHSRIS